jgi:S1-C subfamily serine protease
MRYPAFLLLLCLPTFAYAAPDYQALQTVSVRVDVGQGCGSGVLVTRQVGDVTRTYVWTAGHVAEVLRKMDGTFGQATIYQEIRENGKLIGKRRSAANVVSYSDPDSGEDLALLEINRDNFVALSVSATFDLSDTIQPVGTPLIHCGSTLGLYNSISLGIMSQTDRDLLRTGRTFDQTSVMAYPGSSGGGVYTQDGKCIGLLVRGVGAGLNFIVPARRIVPWAKKMKVEWAVNPAIKVPTRVVRVETPLDDGTACNPVLDESTANRTPTLAPPKCPVIPLAPSFRPTFPAALGTALRIILSAA